MSRAGITVGTRFPAFATSMGRVLLAALPGELRERTLDRSAVEPLTDRTETDRARLREILDAVQRDGWAFVDQELEAGLRSLAVPVVGRDGTVIAAVNVSMSATDPLTDSLTQLPTLQQTARSITADLSLTRPH